MAGIKDCLFSNTPFFHKGKYTIHMTAKRELKSSAEQQTTLCQSQPMTFSQQVTYSSLLACTLFKCLQLLLRTRKQEVKLDGLQKSKVTRYALLSFMEANSTWPGPADDLTMPLGGMSLQIRSWLQKENEIVFSPNLWGTEAQSMKYKEHKISCELKAQLTHQWTAVKKQNKKKKKLAVFSWGKDWQQVKSAADVIIQTEEQEICSLSGLSRWHV